MAAIAFASIVSAQTFSLQYSTMEEDTEGTPGDNPDVESIVLKNYIINESDATIENLKWKFEEVDLPFGWSIFDLCDNQICHTQSQVNNILNNNLEPPFAPISVEGDPQYNELKLRVYVPEYADDGTGTVKIKLTHYTDDTATGVIQEETATFIVRKNATSTEIIDMKDERVAVFPNPSNGQLFLYTDLSLDARSFQVFDLMGRIVLTGNISDETTSVDASSLQTGNYLIKIIDGNENSITTRKWIKK